MNSTIITLRDGRPLEIGEYGEAAGSPVVFLHGLIGSYHQASYVADEALRAGLRVIAPNRPGVGRSEFKPRASALEAVDDLEDLAAALRLETFSVIGISGGAPYALAALLRFAPRVRSVTLISGMGPMRLRGALKGMDARRRAFLNIAARAPGLARRGLEAAARRFHKAPRPFLQRLVTTWSRSDQKLFERPAIFDLFMKDLHAVFSEGAGAETLAHELRIYRGPGFALDALPASRRVVLWHGLDDNIVSPEMAWCMTRALPSAETHFLPGGHFMAIEHAREIMERLTRDLGAHRPPNSDDHPAALTTAAIAGPDVTPPP